MRDQPTKETMRGRYANKLLDNRWQQRKTSIQIRDQFQCQKCHNEEEQAADIIKEMAPTLQYHGYFNTEIRDFVNKLIESKLKSNGERMVST